MRRRLKGSRGQPLALNETAVRTIRDRARHPAAMWLEPQRSVAPLCSAAWRRFGRSFINSNFAMCRYGAIENLPCEQVGAEIDVRLLYMRPQSS
jgi:hypothetical protein